MGPSVRLVPTRQGKLRGGSQQVVAVVQWEDRQQCRTADSPPRATPAVRTGSYRRRLVQWNRTGAAFRYSEAILLAVVAVGAWGAAWRCAGAVCDRPLGGLGCCLVFALWDGARVQQPAAGKRFRLRCETATMRRMRRRATCAAGQSWLLAQRFVRLRWRAGGCRVLADGQLWLPLVLNGKLPSMVSGGGVRISVSPW